MDKETKQKLEELITEIGEVYKGNDWLVVKKYILKFSSPKHRKFFSTRDYKSKKQTLNNFEISLIDFYENKFGTRLYIDEEKKLHKT
tara:strand:- start:421 stop:681 length:261 start_codon:yes stop_codon:yes gene_type:complete